MKGFVIMLFIFSLMMLLVISEEIYIRKISKEIVSDIDFNKPITNTELCNIINKWESNKTFLSLFINESYLQTIQTEIKLAEYNLENHNMDFLMQNLISIKEKVKNLPSI